jgi:biotin operon repressor
MTYGDLDDAQSPISKRIAELRGKGYRIFQVPEWEHTRAEIYYAE